MLNIQKTKTLFLFAYAFVTFLTIGLNAEPVNLSPQEKWDALFADVDYWVDGAGYPIDEGIKETVVALNLIGLETTASCEGHLDHGNAHPWVNIEIYPLAVQKIMQEFAESQEKLEREKVRLIIKLPGLSYKDLFDHPEAEHLRDLNEKNRHLGALVQEIQMKYLEPLNQLLDEFYQTHKTTYDNTLLIQQIYAHSHQCILWSIGAERQQIRSAEERSIKLAEYREEMQAFTAFVKQKFMNAMTR